MDLLRSLATRVVDTASLVLVTYRTDEVGPDHPLAVLLGDLATSPAMCVHDVPPLSVDAVQALIDDGGVDVTQRTCTSARAATPSTSPRCSRPAATRCRPACGTPYAPASHGSVPSRAALSTSWHWPASAPSPSSSSTCSATRPTPRTRLCVRACSSSSDEGLTFRHDLARRTVADDVPPMRRIALHRAILHSLQGTSELSPTRHASPTTPRPRASSAAAPDAAIDGSALQAPSSAPTARPCSSTSAHSRMAASDDPDGSAIVEGLSYELYLTGRIDDAITQRAEALHIYQARDDRLGLAIHASLDVQAALVLRARRGGRGAWSARRRSPHARRGQRGGSHGAQQPLAAAHALG